MGYAGVCGKDRLVLVETNQLYEVRNLGLGSMTEYVNQSSTNGRGTRHVFRSRSLPRITAQEVRNGNVMMPEAGYSEPGPTDGSHVFQESITKAREVPLT